MHFRVRNIIHFLNLEVNLVAFVMTMIVPWMLLGQVSEYVATRVRPVHLWRHQQSRVVLLCLLVVQVHKARGATELVFVFFWFGVDHRLCLVEVLLHVSWRVAIQH